MNLLTILRFSVLYHLHKYLLTNSMLLFIIQTPCSILVTFLFHLPVVILGIEENKLLQVWV